MHPGVLRYPTGPSYLNGDKVVFSCKPEYFLHGDAVRECRNGTWNPGWWVWCRGERWQLKRSNLLACLLARLLGRGPALLRFLSISWRLPKLQSAPKSMRSNG